MKKVNLLSRAEMKNVMGGYVDPDELGTPGGNNGNPCVNCSNIWHSDGDLYGSGNCNTRPYSSTCHNYCADSGQPSYWC